MPNLTEQLKRDGHLLDRPKKEPKRRTPLRPISKKREGANREYLKRRKRFLRLHYICEAKIKLFCRGCSQDVHHVKGRGPHLLHENTWLAVCRHCHDWIHAHPAEARELGLLA